MSNVYSDKILNGNKILQVGQVEIIADAAGANDATRKSQVESISAAAVQSGLVNSNASASETTTFTSQYTSDALATKQPNMSIDPASTSYLEIVDGSKIKLKDLGITSTYRDTVQTSLSGFIGAATFNGNGTITINGEVLDKMTFIFLTNAVLPQDRTFVYLGTNNGDATDFVAFGVNYNASEIRSFFNSTGTGILFDTNTGVFSLDIGTTASELGGQTIPHGATFTTISPGSDIKDALLKLEALINAVDQSGADGTAAVTTRLNNLSGVTGSNMGTFSGNVFSDNKNVKQLLQESETAHESATSDRAAIYAQMSARATTVDANLASAVSTLENADTAETTARQSGDSSLQTGLNALNANLTTETNRATAAENVNAAAISQEVADRTSAVTAESAARTAADNTETNRATAAEDALQDQIDNIVSNNKTFVASIDAAGKFVATSVADSRDGDNFVDVAMVAGEYVIFSADGVSLLGNTFNTNDQLTCKKESITAGAMTFNDFIYSRADKSDLTRTNLGSDTVDLDSNDDLRVTPDSIDRTQLAASVEADIDDKISLTQANSITTIGNTWVVDDSSTGEFGGTQLIYAALDSTATGGYSGTHRMYLDIHKVYTNGSGNPVSPSQAVVRTQELEYHGNCQDFSVNIVTDNAELNHHTPTAKTNSTARVSSVTGVHAGLSAGHTSNAEGSTLQNMAQFSHAPANGIATDAGNYGFLSASGDTLAAAAAWLAVNPAAIGGLPFDAASVADARKAGSGYAHVSLGRPSYFDLTQPVTVASCHVSGSNDNSAVNLGDLKDLCEIHAFDLSSGSKVITTSLDLTKTKPAEFMHNVTGVEIGFSYDSANSEITITATGNNVSSLTSVKMFIEQLPCAITNS